MINSISKAKKLALDLSDNLYYEDNFTSECFRVFLDSLPPIFRVTFQVVYDKDSSLKGFANIVFVNSKFKSIAIAFNSSWIYYTYFRYLRKVSFTLHIDIPYPHEVLHLPH